MPPRFEEVSIELRDINAYVTPLLASFAVPAWPDAALFDRLLRWARLSLVGRPVGALLLTAFSLRLLAALCVAVRARRLLARHRALFSKKSL